MTTMTTALLDSDVPWTELPDHSDHEKVNEVREFLVQIWIGALYSNEESSECVPRAAGDWRAIHRPFLTLRDKR
jgi:hypothetical protein